MPNSRFLHRHSIKRSSQGEIIFDEHSYLNQDSYVLALKELLHCFAYGDCYWGAGYTSLRRSSPYFSFELFTEGDAVIVCENHKYQVKAGDLLMKKFRHQFKYSTGPSNFARKHNLLLSYTPLQSMICDLLFPDDLNIVQLPAPEKLLAIMQKIRREVTASNYNHEELQALIFRFLLEIQQQINYTTYPELLARAIRFITMSFSREINREKLAAHCGVSISTLTRLFRKHLECSPGQYLIRYRLEQACHLLMIHDTSIKNIAAECGFSSPMFFSREFKQHYGVSPTTYRKQQRKMII